jgi:glyoxylase-like metal-dependent hydrolase (beta-lactamase superfamily II)
MTFQCPEENHMPAEMKGDLRPEVFRFAWGEAEITTILEGAVQRDSVKPPFCLDKSDADIAAIGAANRIPVDAMQHSFVPTVINTGSELVLFDVGFGSGGAGTGCGRLAAQLAAAGYAPGDIDVVAFTHCHPDHIQGVMENGALAFPDARHVIGRREFDAWKSGADIPSQRDENRALFFELIAPMEERLTFLEDGDSVTPGLTAEAAYGHSIGHMMYRLESGGAQFLVWGDVTNHYVYSLQHPDSTVGFDDDKDAAIATRKRVLDMVATEGLLVSGYHMPFPSVGYVEKTGSAYRWVPASYQMYL